MLILFKYVYNCFRIAGIFETQPFLAQNTRVLRTLCKVLTVKMLFSLMLFKYLATLKILAFCVTSACHLRQNAWCFQALGRVK